MSGEALVTPTCERSLLIWVGRYPPSKSVTFGTYDFDVSVLPFDHNRDDGPGVIAGVAKRPQLDQIVMAVTMNVHQYLKVNPVCAVRSTRGQVKHSENVT
jgi:hypothetical protein